MPVEYSPQQTYQAVADPVTGYALNQFDWSVVVPEGTQNYFTNPSIESATIGSSFCTTSNAAVARDSVNSVFGLYSLKVTPSSAAASQVGLIAAGSLPAGPVTFSCYVKGTAGELMFLSFKDVVAGGQQPTFRFTATGLWQRFAISGLVEGLTLASSLPVLYVGKTTPNTNPFYVDALQLELKPYATTFCDGMQPGCSWSGPQNASTSARPGNAGGGREYRLTKLDFIVTAISGHDMPPYEAHVQEYGLVGGQEYQGTTAKPQIVVLSNAIEGSTYPVTRQTKDKIVELLAPYSSQYKDRKLYLLGRLVDDCKKFTPVQIGPTLRMPARVAASDLAGINDNYNQERFALSFICDNPPAIEAVYESKQLLNPSTVLTGFTGRMTYFKAAGAQPGLNASNLNKWQTPTGIVLAGSGVQTTAMSTNQTQIPYPVASSATTFLAITDGTNSYIVDAPNMNYYLTAAVNNTINTLAFDPINGYLYAGGSWTSGASTYLYKIDSAGAISAIGTTNIPNNVVRALVVVPYMSQLFAFGDFTNSGTRWGRFSINGFGTTWANPTGGAGFNNTVRGALLLQNGKILVFGDFTSVDGVTQNRAVIFDPYTSTFSAVASGFSNGSVRSAVQLPNGDIVFGGTFTLTGTGLTTSFVALYNGSQILPLGNNTLGGQVNSVAYFQGAVYAAGVYVTVPDAVGRNQACYGLVVLVGDYWVTPDIFTLFDGTGAGGTFVGTGGGALYASSSASLGAAFAAAVGAVSYDGTADAYPTIMIKATGQSTLFSIVNQVSGAAIYFNNLIIATNETITIECAPTGLTATSNLYGDVSRFIMANSDFSGFALLKRNTGEAAAADYTNPIQVLASLSGTIELYWRTTFQGFSAASTAAMSGL